MFTRRCDVGIKMPTITGNSIQKKKKKHHADLEKDGDDTWGGQRV